jgi:poly-gamma-glutamate capsule biosynthesis protein CapA/YwtB (metallophosphatase superfamily)
MIKKALLCLSILIISHVTFSQDTTRLSLLFLGDIMQHDSQISDAWDPDRKKYDYSPCFKNVKPITESADLAIANLELTLAGPPYKGYPQFSAPDELLVALKDMGLDALVTANNHCVDRGKQGLERTIRMLDSLDMPHTGTFTDDVERLNLTPLILEKKGFKLAILNYTYGTNGLPVYKPNIVNMLDTAQIRKDLIRARSLDPDVTIVFVHWGAEYQSLPSVVQERFGNFFFKHGAQIVIGAHPHVIQPMEWKKSNNQFIAYSLGNFVSGQRKRYTDGGAMVRLELAKVQSNGKTITRVENPSYILQWVQRDRGNYYILPVSEATEKTANLNENPDHIAAYRTFVNDSRSLLDKYNKGVPEYRR